MERLKDHITGTKEQNGDLKEIECTWRGECLSFRCFSFLMVN